MKNLGQEHANLDQQAYRIIKKMIRDRQLLPGDKIPQESLAQELGISRTPLVSALKYMEKEKLIESKPRRGFFVRLFTRDEMISIFELREVLEGLAARHAARNVTDRDIARLRRFFSGYTTRNGIKDFKPYCDEDRGFHSFVTEVGAKEFLKSILQTYNIISFSYQFLSSDGLVRAPDETIGEHLAIIDAICDRDAESAEQLMRRHFQRSIAALKRNDSISGERGEGLATPMVQRPMSGPAHPGIRGKEGLA
jgi:DNA-binding GntR family transcriptional regulator